MCFIGEVYTSLVSLNGINYQKGKIMGKIMGKKVEVAGIMGPVWFMGWLFTLGFLKVTFFQGLLALIIWPYYIGDFLSRIPVQ